MPEPIVGSHTEIYNIYRKALGRDIPGGALGTLTLKGLESLTPTQIKSKLSGGWQPSTAEVSAEEATIKASGLATQQRQLLATQKKEEEALFGRFETAIAGQEKLPAMYQRISQELGIPGQQEVVGGLRNEILRIEGLLEALPVDVKSRVKGTFTTEAMRRRLEAVETEPLTRGLSTVARAQEKATGTLGELLGGLGTQMGLETTQMEKELLPIKERLDAFGDRAAREITGYTSANQMELDVLMQKVKMAQELTRDEQARAHDLSLLEKQYELEKEELKTEVVTAGGRIKLINSKTGATIADLGAKTTVGTAGEREKVDAKSSLAEDAKQGITTGEAISMYADRLSLSDIKKIYNKESIYGPTEMSAKDMRERYRKTEQEYGTIKTGDEGGMWIDEQGRMHFD